ncbi:hypothetical protein, partial [Mesorhizobium sp. M7A.F.Ca.CA.001.10.2.1]|uniref:hypothetical protein n=1 Tax=Mesorhizobium sp. M7A.F.Ca.CA.001.10.2.1 TaxID=2496720 RepID=UPI0019D2899A
REINVAYTDRFRFFDPLEAFGEYPERGAQDIDRVLARRYGVLRGEPRDLQSEEELLPGRGSDKAWASDVDRVDVLGWCDIYLEGAVASFENAAAISISPGGRISGQRPRFLSSSPCKAK